MRIDNPHPQRELVQLVVEAVDRPWSTLLLLAATLTDAAPLDADGPPADGSTPVPRPDPRPRAAMVGAKPGSRVDG